MSDKKFKDLYKKLNPEQKKAVDTVEGPVMVIAGPGTGKTTILTLRIANILKKTDADPDSILALTFTESAVHSMREKLVDIIGSDAYKIAIHTFHGFANSVISRNPDSFPRIVGSRHISEIERVEILEAVIADESLDILRPYGNPYFYVRPSLGSIQDLKRDNISPADFKEYIKEQEETFEARDDTHHKKGRFKGQMKSDAKADLKKIEKNKELLLVYGRYEETLREKNLYDFEDMILEVVKALEEDENLLRDLQEKYHYVLADEHQDANFSQNRLLELLSSYHDFPNLFIVGDEKQAIFRFQGASLENFLYFKRTFPEAQIISLVSNYRSSQVILDAAHSLISDAGGGDAVERERLISKTGLKDEEISIFECRDPLSERNFAALKIKELIEDGVSPQEIAVLYRDNKDAFPIAEVLEREKIPFVIESNIDILSDGEILKLRTFLNALKNLSDEESLASILYFDFFDLDPLTVHKLVDESAQTDKKILTLLRESSGKGKSLAKGLSSWSKVFHNKPALDAFEIIVRESGFLTHIMNLDDSVEKMSRLDRFFEEIRRAGENKLNFYLRDFLKYLERLDRYSMKITGTEEVFPNRAVRLMTAHKSKGLEFGYVFVIDVTDGHWGNRRRMNHFSLPSAKNTKEVSDEDDERRLFYVAVTRAKKKVFITYAGQKEDGRKVLRSQFVEEIEEKFIKHSTPNFPEKKLSRKVLESKPKKRPSFKVEEKEYLKSLFLERGLSVTALNNYLSCPWTYFFQNLIRIPKAPNKFQRYGTAIHDTLFFYFESLKKGIRKDTSETLKFFRKVLKKVALSDAEYRELEKKGRKALSGYLKFYKGDFEKNILNEFDIKGVRIPIGGEKIILKGKLDKIEVLEGGARVVDYKTGKPKSRNAIEGKTKSSEGNYKRQLVFYKILLDNFEKADFKMVSGVIDFVEPDNKGAFRREEFQISDEEVDELEDLIKKVSGEILDLSFKDDRCGDKRCQYCLLADAMRMDQKK